MLLKSVGFGCVAASSPAEAIERASTEDFDCALIDLNYARDTTSGQEGLDLLQSLLRRAPDMAVVVMTAWGSIELAVKAMQAGAADFVEKPWENRRLLNVLGSQVQLSRERRRTARLNEENRLLRNDSDFASGFVATAPSMQPVLEIIQRVAPTDANVLLLGENGTGKGIVASEIHRLSLRGEQGLIKVNMGGIADSVFESEMFGHTKGAFTDARADRIGRFELADGGTLFLDEVANIPASQQPKLLRVLEEGEFERLGSSRSLKVDVRLLSATNADLDSEVGAGRFRKDLLFRLNTVEVRLPPLRDRVEDIEPIAHAALARLGRRYQREDLRIAPSALRQMRQYHWPGNVRELHHVVERSLLLADGPVIEDVRLSMPEGPPPATSSITGSGRGGTTIETLESVERRHVRTVLERFDGNVQRAAEALGLSRSALYRRLEKFGIAQLP